MTKQITLSEQAYTALVVSLKGKKEFSSKILQLLHLEELFNAEIKKYDEWLVNVRKEL